MRTNLLKRKERKLEEQLELRALCEDMLKDADESDVPVIEQQLLDCQRRIETLILEIRALKA